MNAERENLTRVKGVFSSTEELDRYEKFWLFDVYKPSYDELSEKVYYYCYVFTVCECDQNFFLLYSL